MTTIKQEFICDLINKCNKYLEIPILLPCCGSTICHEHENDIEMKDGYYICPVCSQQKQHLIFDNGFPINKKLNNLIKNKFHLGLIQKNANKSLDILKSLIDDYVLICPDVFIYDYFAKIRNKIDLHREYKLLNDESLNNKSTTKINEDIHKKSNEMLAILKEYEHKSMKNIQRLTKPDLSKLDYELIPIWKKRMRNPNLTDNETNMLLEEIESKKVQLLNDIYNIKIDLLNFNIVFNPFDLFGELKIIQNEFKISKKCGKLIKSFDIHEYGITSIKLINNSSKLISSAEDNTIKIFDFETGECLKSLEEHSDWVTCILLDTNNNRLISGSWDRTIKIWNMNDYKCIKTLKNDSKICTLAFVSDNLFAAGTQNGSVNIWNLNDYNMEKSVKIYDSWVIGLLVTNETMITNSGSNDYMINVLSLKTFQIILQLSHHNQCISIIKLLPNGNLISGSIDEQTLIVWNIETGECLTTIKFDENPGCIEIFDYNRLIIGLSTDTEKGNAIIIYDLNENKEVTRFDALNHSNMNNLIILSNGNLIASSYNYGIKIWNCLISVNARAYFK